MPMKKRTKIRTKGKDADKDNGARSRQGMHGS